MTIALPAPDRETRAVRDETTSGETGFGRAMTTILALTSVTAASGLLCQPVVGSADFATSSPVVLASGQPGWTTDLWSPAPLPATVATLGIQATAVRSDQDEVRWVKENSGLTWDQLGKVFGVSRRAVHLWANGGRMNEANAEVLRTFAATVAAHLGGSPERTRAALLARDGGAQSVLDSFRRAQIRPAGEAIGAPFAPEEKVESIREEAERA